MKNFVKRLSAVLTAAIMTLSAAGTVSAQDGQQEEAAPKYTGWATSGEYWQYLDNGEPYSSGTYKIDGVMCDFSIRGNYTGVYSGWKNDRRYENGLPYTGWTETTDGKKYCIDGCKVTGDFLIYDKIYSFDKTGKYTGKSRDADVIVFCDEEVCTDTEKIKITLENFDGKSHEFKIAKSFEYFKDGKWVSCKSKVLYSPIDKGLSKKGESLSFEADVKEYSRNKFNEGFYRLPITCGEETYYAVFKAVAPIEVKSQKEEYVFANNAPYKTTKFDLTINSEKEELQAENIELDIEIKIEKKTADGWKNVTDDELTIEETENKNMLTLIPNVRPEEGYYRVTVTDGKNNCTDTFRVRNHMAAAWLDEYDLNSKNLTISFNVTNCGGEPIKICTFPYGLYQKNSDGTWQASDVEGAAVEISSDAYTTLKSKESKTVNFDISNYYNMSELKAGNYAVDIGGIGRAEFTLTDKPTERNFPFKNLKAKDIDEIHIEDSSCELINTAVLKRGNSEPSVTDTTDEYGIRRITADMQDSSYFNNAIGYLRQLEFTSKGKNPNNIDLMLGGDDRTKIIFKDGTEILLDFNGSGEVVYDGKLYYCSKYTCNALEAIVKKFTQRNLPFYGLNSESFKEIRFKDIGCNEVTTAVLDRNEVYFGDHVYSIINLELLNEFEDFDTPVGGSVFSVTMTYKNGKSETITIYGHDVVLMPDGKAYYCFEWQFNNIYKIFEKLEHSVSYIEPDYSLPEDPIEEEQN